MIHAICSSLCILDVYKRVGVWGIANRRLVPAMSEGFVSSQPLPLPHRGGRKTGKTEDATDKAPATIRVVRKIISTKAVKDGAQPRMVAPSYALVKQPYPVGLSVSVTATGFEAAAGASAWPGTPFPAALSALAIGDGDVAFFPFQSSKWTHFGLVPEAPA